VDFLKKAMGEVMRMKRLPIWEELENIRKKIEAGFELGDWEIWVSKEFLG